MLEEIQLHRVQEGLENLGPSWLPELHCALGEPGKDAIECGLVYVPPQGNGDISNGGLRREVVINAQ
jgi:hypothetical protein